MRVLLSAFLAISAIASPTEGEGKVSRAAQLKPCDTKCCPCAARSFNNFPDKAEQGKSTPSFLEIGSDSEAQCVPCEQWRSTWVQPEYHSYCSESPCTVAGGVLPYQYMQPSYYYQAPSNYINPDLDYPRDYYSTSGYVDRYIPGYGTMGYDSTYYYPFTNGGRFGPSEGTWTGHGYYSGGRYHRGSKKLNKTDTAGKEEASKAVAEQIKAKTAVIMQLRTKVGLDVTVDASATTKVVQKTATRTLEKPCDLNCCKCAEKTFNWEEQKPKFLQTSADSTCTPCSTWVDAFALPGGRDFCGTPACSSGYSPYPPYYSSIPPSYVRPAYDQPREYRYANGSVVVHDPITRTDSTYPPNWGTGFAGNGWNNLPYGYYSNYW